VSELRYDVTAGEWVIVAGGRGARPQEFIPGGAFPEGLPDWSATCPFCPGNEKETPPPVLSLPDPQQPDRWLVRAFPNKYPAMVPDPEPAESTGGLFQSRAGTGGHEVIVETPIHNQPPADFDDRHLAAVLRAYRERYLNLTARPGVRYVLPFKNQGEQAGISLSHPHSQMLALPAVPEREERRVRIASQYHEQTGRCLYCDVAREELATGERVVLQSEQFAVFQPFFASRPAETWILPKAHQASFSNADDLDALAAVLGAVLRRLREAFGDPAYNYVIHSAPPGTAEQSYHWHLRLLPYLARPAGLELGTGMWVNPFPPEETARRMRG
jgi:UDPglucose--hexose-1-phosphate uridylyltransferase